MLTQKVTNYICTECGSSAPCELQVTDFSFSEIEEREVPLSDYYQNIPSVTPPPPKTRCIYSDKKRANWTITQKKNTIEPKLYLYQNSKPRINLR